MRRGLRGPEKHQACCQDGNDHFFFMSYPFALQSLEARREQAQVKGAGPPWAGCARQLTS